MQRTFFLHAGPPKTGSTSIQVYFRDNAPAFLAQRLYRPATGTAHRSHYHFDLVRAFAEPGHPLLDQLTTELRERGFPDRVFVSAECFAAKLSDPAYVAALKGFCDSLHYRLHVIAYVRPQEVMLNSLYAQHVKNWSKVGSMEEFVAREIDRGRHDYLKQFALLRTDLAIDLTLRPFSRSVLAGGLTSDLCRVLCVDPPGDAAMAPEEPANVTPGPRTIAAFDRLRRQLYRAHPGTARGSVSALTSPLLRAAGALGWNEVKFGGVTPALQNEVEQHFGASNAELARFHWAADWKDVFSPADRAPPPYNVFVPAHAPPTERRAFREFIDQAMETITELLAAQNGQRVVSGFAEVTQKIS